MGEWGNKKRWVKVEGMNICPYCQSSENQVKAGKNKSGSQKYLCKRCGRRNTPEPSQMYGDEIRLQAVKLSVDGMNYRRIARHLGVDHKTIINWVNAYVAQLPAAELPKDVNNAEMDEQYTFIGSKKQSLRDDDCGSYDQLHSGVGD